MGWNDSQLEVSQIDILSVAYLVFSSVQVDENLFPQDVYFAVK